MIAKIDHTFRCQECEAEAHDIIADENHHWMIQCAFCGSTQRVRAIAGAVPKATSDFAFSSGRYVGKTLEQVVADEHGRNYLLWAAENHPQKRVKELCKTWLDRQTVA